MVRDLDLATGASGAAIMHDCSVWPDFDGKPLNEKTRGLAEVKAHRAAEIAISGSPAWQGLMRTLGRKFSKAKTAAEVKYHPVTQGEAVGEFVGGNEKEREKRGRGEGKTSGHGEESKTPSPPLVKDEGGRMKDEVNAAVGVRWERGEPALTPGPSPLSTGEGRDGDVTPSPECRRGRNAKLLLIDSILDDKTVAAYDKPWSAITPHEIPLGWRAAGIVVHPTNPVSVISFRQLRDVYEGKIKDWSEVGEAGSKEYTVHSKEYDVQSKEYGVQSREYGGTLAIAKGAIRSTARRRMIQSAGWWKDKLGLGRQHVTVLPRGDVAN